MNSKTSKLPWPTWLTDAGPEMRDCLETIAASQGQFRAALHDGYKFERVMQSQVAALLDPLVANGSIDPKTGSIKKPFQRSREGKVLMLYQCASGHRYLAMLCAAKQLALLHLLDAAMDSLLKGNVIAGFTCFRSVIEHVSHFHSLVTKLPLDLAPKSFKHANDTLWEIHGSIMKAALSTRFDWEKLKDVDGTKAFERLDIEYKAAENRLDLFVKSIFGPIDSLGKRIKGIRNVYEFLCEFAHPNIGIRYGLVHSSDPYVDRQGVGWIREELNFKPPLAFVSAMGPSFCVVFSKIADCLLYFDQALAVAKQQGTKIQQLTQYVIRECLLVDHQMLDPYALCPCASGSKVKFCCGSTKKH